MPPVKTRRAWLRIHLSTALVLMVLAGGLVGLNVRERVELGKTVGIPAHNFTECYDRYGWPFDAIASWHFIWQLENGVRTNTQKSWFLLENQLAADIAVFLSILFAVWFVLEWRINRQAAKRK